MDYTNKWKIIEDVGEGGQGKVYRVIGLDVYSKNKTDIIGALRDLTAGVVHAQSRDAAYEKFSKALPELVKMQDPSEHCALKVLHPLQDARDANLASERMRREIQAMSENLHPSLIEILEVDPDVTWYVSQFYPNGTLAHHREMFKGSFLKALKAIRPLVEGVAKLHKKGYVHRDIKPQNIFLTLENDLILGDFRLIYFEDDRHTRISATYENVGSRDWMPPWAMGIRIEDVKPSFDVFCLGKVLWSMVSGKPVLQLWYFDRDRFNVERLFPQSPTIKFANPLFAKCIVEGEESCIPDAGLLLQEIDRIVSRIQLSAERTERIDSMQEYEHLKALVAEIDFDVNKAEGGNMSAGTRVRKQMQKVKQAAQLLRNRILEIRYPE